MQSRLVLMLVLALCAVIFVVQNMFTTEFRILFVTIQMPALIFYAVLLAIGFVLGMLVSKKK